MNKIKVVVAGVLFGTGLAIAAPAILSSQALEGGDCIYSEFRSIDGICYGATTRLCQGPSTCPK